MKIEKKTRKNVLQKKIIIQKIHKAKIGQKSALTGFFLLRIRIMNQKQESFFFVHIKSINATHLDISKLQRK